MTHAAPHLHRASPVADLLETHLADASRVAGAPEWLWRIALAEPLRDFLTRPGKEFRARLVTASYALGGGEQPVPDVLPLLVEILHAGSLIVDDIQDGSLVRRGGPSLHAKYGVPVALNAGNWLYFWALDLIGGLEVAPDVELALHRRFACTLRSCHEGQALDLAGRVHELSPDELCATVRKATELKTGRLMQLSAELGACAAGAEETTVAALGEFGRRVGIGLQMLDDLGGIVSARRAHKGHEDLRHASPTWLWVWLAERSDPAVYDHCVETLRRVTLGEKHPDDCARLLRQEVAPIGKRRVRVQLYEAIDELRQRIGFSPLLADIHHELKRMEQSYE